MPPKDGAASILNSNCIFFITRVDLMPVPKTPIDGAVLPITLRRSPFFVHTHFSLTDADENPVE
jgi:hypothetical protein